MTRKNVDFVTAHLREYPAIFTGVLLCGFINSCASFLLPVSIGEFFVFRFHTGGSKRKLLSWLGIHLNSLNEFYLLFGILLLIKTITGFIETYYSYRSGELFVKNIREEIFVSQMKWDISLLSKKKYGKYLLRYSNDMKAIQNYFTKGVLEGIKSLFFLLTGLFILSKIHLYLTLIFLMLLLLLTGIISIIAKYQRPYIIAARTNRSSLLAFVATSLSGFEKIKQQRKEIEKMSNFNTRSGNLYLANMKSNLLESISQSISSFLIFFMIGILLWQMTFPMGHIKASEGVMMILIVLMMQTAIKKLLKVPGHLNKGNISLQKVTELLQNPIMENIPPVIIAEESNLQKLEES